MRLAALAPLPTSAHVRSTFLARRESGFLVVQALHAAMGFHMSKKGGDSHT